MAAVAVEGRWSTDGSKLAYRPNNAAYSGPSGWRLYRGGSTPPVWIIDLNKQQLEKVPHPNANDSNPFWLNNRLYFLSDRDNKAVNLYQYQQQHVSQLTHSTTGIYAVPQGTVTLWCMKLAAFYTSWMSAAASVAQFPVQIDTMSAQRRPQWKDASKTCHVNPVISDRGNARSSQPVVKFLPCR